MRNVRVVVGSIIAAVALLIGAPAQAEKRVALLTGNNAYHNVLALNTAINDTRTLADVLRKLNFSVLVARKPVAPQHERGAARL